MTTSRTGGMRKAPTCQHHYNLYNGFTGLDSFNLLGSATVSVGVGFYCSNHFVLSNGDRVYLLRLSDLYFS